ncbi:hypothetical protein IMCC26134_15130 [Verrucomicrobia bacterium IMCC26134]|nr:hypothetical protein IMCC26134_15130 [Verrucomicrobia bacterium IMCC26134]
MNLQTNLNAVKTSAQRIQISQIHPSPLNPRMVAKADRAALAASLKTAGQLVAVWVRPHPTRPGHYELVDGERRWWGAQEAGLTALEAQVGDWSDDHILQIAWVTGTEGRGLTVLEQARWARSALSRAGATLDKVAALAGVSGSSIHRCLALLELPDFAQDAVQGGTLAPQTAYLIAGVPGVARAKFAQEVLTPEDVPGPLSYLDAHALRSAKYSRTLKGAPFDTADEGLLPAAGACSSCHYRAGNNPTEYGVVKNPHTCMNPGCYEDKLGSMRHRLAARGAGRIALDASENARIFQGGSIEPHPESGYAIATRPIPQDLLKAEVIAQGRPSFSEVSPAARLFIGTDGHGRLVDLVLIREALAATTEPDIFRAGVAAEYVLRGNTGSTHTSLTGERVETPSMACLPASHDAQEPTHGSLAGSEKAAKRAEQASVKSKARKLRASAEWMLQLYDALSADKQPKGFGYTRASLRWEHLLRCCDAEDALLVVKAITEEDPKVDAAKGELMEIVSALTNIAQLEAICDLLILAPALRAEGSETKWVAEWHQHLVIPSPNYNLSEDQAQAEIEKSHEAPDPIVLTAQEAGGLHPVIYTRTAEEEAADAQVDRLEATTEVASAFRFNENGVSINPTFWTVPSMPKKTECSISTALAPDGLWRYGYDFHARGASMAHSSGRPLSRGEGSYTEIEAVLMGLAVAAGWFHADAQALAAVQRHIVWVKIQQSAVEYKGRRMPAGVTLQQVEAIDAAEEMGHATLDELVLETGVASDLLRAVVVALGRQDPAVVDAEHALRAARAAAAARPKPKKKRKAA